MNDIKVVLSNIDSHIKDEDYFPLSVSYDTIAEEVRHVGFYKNDDDLLELTVAKDSGRLITILLTICHHYSIEDSCFDYSSILPSNDDVTILLPDHNECDTFNMIVYTNCVVIHISVIKPSKYVKCGQVLFGIDSSNQICSLIVTEITETNINHIINELSLQ